MRRLTHSAQAIGTEMDKPESKTKEPEKLKESSSEINGASDSAESQEAETSRNLLADTSDEYLFGDSKNGITARDLEEISSSLSNNMDDVVKLGHLAKSMKSISMLDTEDNAPQKIHAPRIGREDLKWALSKAGTDVLGERTEIRRPDRSKPEEEQSSQPDDIALPFGDLTREVKRNPESDRISTTKGLYADNRIQPEEWRRIRRAMDFDNKGMDNLLPDLALTESNDSSRIRVRETDRGTETYDPESGIRTMTRDGKTVARVGQDVTVSREGDRTVYKSGDRVIFEQVGGKKIVALENGGKVEIEGREATVYMDGRPGYKLNTNGAILEHENAVLISARGAKTVEDAVESARLQMDLSSSDKPIVITRSNGMTMVRDGKIIADFFNGSGEGQPQEATFFISADKKLVRTGDGKVLIRTKDKPDVELNREQIDYLLSKLGDKADFIRNTLKALDTGASVVVDENISFTMKRHIEGVVANGPHSRDALRFAIGTGQFVTREAGSETRYNTEEGTLHLKTKSGEETVLTPTEKGIDVRNRELEMKDGRVTFTSSDTVINNDGSIELGNGTRIDTSGDVHLLDGTTIKAGSGIERSGELALNQPTEKSLEIYMNFARSLASSVSARAQSGSVSLSDIAMLKANMSIIANYMGFFSQLGNMEVVNSLRASWSLVKASLDKAEPKMQKRREWQEAHQADGKMS